MMPNLLAEIPPEDLRRDCPGARTLAVQHRGTIYRQGEPANAVFCVLAGQVTIARSNAEGAILTTGALVDAPSVTILVARHAG